MLRKNTSVQTAKPIPTIRNKIEVFNELYSIFNRLDNPQIIINKIIKKFIELILYFIFLCASIKINKTNTKYFIIYSKELSIKEL